MCIRKSCKQHNREHSRLRCLFSVGLFVRSCVVCSRLRCSWVLQASIFDEVCSQVTQVNDADYANEQRNPEQTIQRPKNNASANEQCNCERLPAAALFVRGCVVRSRLCCSIAVARAVHHGPRLQYRSNRTEYRIDRIEIRKNFQTAEKSRGWLGF